MSKSASAQTPVAKRPARPRDPVQLAHFLVAEATQEAAPTAPAPKAVAPPKKPQRKKAPPKVKAGRLGGLASGKVRVEKISPERRREIAQKAAAARWGKEP